MNGCTVGGWKRPATNQKCGLVSCECVHVSLSSVWHCFVIVVQNGRVLKDRKERMPCSFNDSLSKNGGRDFRFELIPIHDFILQEGQVSIDHYISSSSIVTLDWIVQWLRA